MSRTTLLHCIPVMVFSYTDLLLDQILLWECHDQPLNWNYLSLKKKNTKNRLVSKNAVTY